MTLMPWFSRRYLVTADFPQPMPPDKPMMNMERVVDLSEKL
jgi:hypothetical protein